MALIQPLDQFEFHHRLAATPGLALVFFTAPACGACKRLRAVLSRAGWEDVSLFEVDAGAEAGVTRELGVFHLPAMFLYRDGQFHCELHAVAEAGALRRALEQALQQPAGEAP